MLCLKLKMLNYISAFKAKLCGADFGYSAEEIKDCLHEIPIKIFSMREKPN